VRKRGRRRRCRYRSGLYTRLTNAGYNFTFVGGSPEPWVSPYGDPTRGGTYKPTFDLRDIGQDNHEGYGGWTIGGIDGIVNNRIDENGYWSSGTFAMATHALKTLTTSG